MYSNNKVGILLFAIVNYFFIFAFFFIGDFSLAGFDVFFILWFFLILYRSVFNIHFSYAEVIVQSIVAFIFVGPILVGLYNQTSYTFVFFKIVLFSNIFPILKLVLDDRENNNLYFYVIIATSLFFLLGMLVMGNSRGGFIFGPNQIYRIFTFNFLCVVVIKCFQRDTSLTASEISYSMFFAFLLSAIGIFFTGSRGGTICLIIIFAIFVWFFVPERNRKLIVLLSFMLLIVLVTNYWSQIQFYFGRLVYFDIENGSESYRLHALYQLLDFLKNENSFSILFGMSDQNPYFPHSNQGGYPHNIIVEFLIYHGLIVSVAIFVFTIYSILSLYHSKYNISLLVFTPFLVGSMLSGSLQDNFPLLAIGMFPFWLKHSVIK